MTKKSLDLQRRRVKIRKILSPPKAAFPRRAFLPKTLTLLGGIGFLVIILLLSLILPEARISVAMRSEPVTRDFEIRLDSGRLELSVAELVIPATIEEKEIEGSRVFSATGVKNIGKIASGFVNIYNFSKTNLILKKETTVLLSGQRKYFFTQDVGNIRPTALIGLEDQEVDPLSLIPPVPVVAEAAGAEYNLKKGARLEIENEVFGAKPKLLYAVVAEDISGGTTQELRVLSESDVVSALNTFKSELIEKNGSTGSKVEVLAEHTSLQPGEEGEKFSAAVKLKIKTLSFEEGQVKKIVTERIKRLLPENKILQESEASRLQLGLHDVNLETGTGMLATHFEGTILYQIDTQELLSKVKGRSAEEIRELLLSRPEIESVEVKFYPFWVKKAPRFEKRINLQVVSQD